MICCHAELLLVEFDVAASFGITPRVLSSFFSEEQNKNKNNTSKKKLFDLNGNDVRKLRNSLYFTQF